MTTSPTVRLSCEFFPVVTEEGAIKLAEVREQLKWLNCEYYSVTYGAGGSTRDRTLSLVKQIRKENHRPVMPHLTCVATSRAEISTLLDQYHELGVAHIMALRGDMPSGSALDGELDSAADLVSLIREKWGDSAHVVVAAYPEIHPRASSPQVDLENFADKCSRGVNEAVTQYFYNVDSFLRFRDDVRELGVTTNIVPGIMPITNYTQLARFSDACGAEIPQWIRKRLEAYQHDLESLREFGADVVARICERLIAEGSDSLHFYSMNRSDAVLAITSRLGWQP